MNQKMLSGEKKAREAKDDATKQLTYNVDVDDVSNVKDNVKRKKNNKKNKNKQKWLFDLYHYLIACGWMFCFNHKEANKNKNQTNETNKWKKKRRKQPTKNKIKNKKQN